MHKDVKHIGQTALVTKENYIWIRYKSNESMAEKGRITHEKQMGPQYMRVFIKFKWRSRVLWMPQVLWQNLFRSSEWKTSAENAAERMTAKELHRTSLQIRCFCWCAVTYGIRYTCWPLLTSIRKTFAIWPRMIRSSSVFEIAIRTAELMGNTEGGWSILKETGAIFWYIHLEWSCLVLTNCCRCILI